MAGEPPGIPEGYGTVLPDGSWVPPGPRPHICPCGLERSRFQGGLCATCAGAIAGLTENKIPAAALVAETWPRSPWGRQQRGTRKRAAQIGKRAGRRGRIPSDPKGIERGLRKDER